MKRRATCSSAIAFRNGLRGYRICMDPIRTAVKYSLMPLRTIVALGEAYVDSGEELQAEAPPTAPARKRAPAAAAKRRPGPQASRTPKDLDDVGLARKVESIIFRDEDVPKGKIDVN